jgi:hypothetical protein
MAGGLTLGFAATEELKNRSVGMLLLIIFSPGSIGTNKG